ncbi:hypothetical protein PR048_012813, partial [Dryococelus australis]
MLSLECDLAGNWKRWKQQHRDDVKVTILLHFCGEEAQDLYSTLDVSVMDAKNYSGNYLLSKINESIECHKFNIRIQEEGESIDSFVTALRLLSTNCSFDALHDDLMKDCIVDKCIKDRLLQKSNLTLAKVVQICKSYEQTQQLLKTIDSDSAVYAVQELHSRSNLTRQCSGIISARRLPSKHHARKKRLQSVSVFKAGFSTLKLEIPAQLVQ